MPEYCQPENRYSVLAENGGRGGVAGVMLAELALGEVEMENFLVWRSRDGAAR